MRAYVDQTTGEIVAVLSMSTWESIAADAHAHDPCLPGTCTSASCRLARKILAANAERETWFGELRASDG